MQAPSTATTLSFVVDDGSASLTSAAHETGDANAGATVSASDAAAEEAAEGV